MTRPAPPHPTTSCVPLPRSTHLDELAWTSESDVLAALALHGLAAFADPDEIPDEPESRLYPFPELSRAGMESAAELAANLGASPWARDGFFDCAADMLARDGKDDKLADFLRKHLPANQNSPWHDRTLEKLWTLCASSCLDASLLELSRFGEPPEQAWEALGKDDPRKARDTYEALLGRAREGNLFSAGIFRRAIILGLPIALIERAAALPGTRLDATFNPWSAACELFEPNALEELAETNMPREGWREASWLKECEPPWDALCMARIDNAESFRRANILAHAGVPPPNTKSLALALRNRRYDYADALVDHGAVPDQECAQLLADLALFDPPETRTAHVKRLSRCLARGEADISRACHSAMHTISDPAWGIELLEAAASATALVTPERRDELLDLALLAISSSRALASCEPHALHEMFSTEYATLSRGRMARALITIAHALDFKDGHGDRPLNLETPQSLHAWWEARILKTNHRPHQNAPARRLCL